MNELMPSSERGQEATTTWHTSLGPGFLAAITLTAGQASADPLSNVWSVALRDSIDVYICEDSFETDIPNLAPSGSTVALRHATRQALDTWNAYSDADFHFVLHDGAPPDADDCDTGASNYPDSQIVVLRAETQGWAGGLCSARAWGGVTSSGGGSGIVRGAVVIFEDSCTGADITNWIFDSSQHANGGGNGDSRDINQVLLHEFGHVLGFVHPATSTDITVMNTATGGTATSSISYQKVLWPEDIEALTDTGNTFRYNRVTDRPIEHERSTDTGLNWSPEAWSPLVYTNSTVGVASNGAGTYVVAWSDTTATRDLHVLTTNGSSTPTNTANLGTDVMGGPAVAWGNLGGTSTFVVAATERTNDRRVRIFTSQNNGSSWSNRGTVAFRYTSGEAPSAYGSKYEPALAFNLSHPLIVSPA